MNDHRKHGITPWEWLLMTAIVLGVLFGYAALASGFDRGQDIPPGAELHCERNASFLGGQDPVCEPYWP